MPAFFRRISTNPIIELAPPPVLSERSKISLQHFSNVLTAENIENQEILMVEEISIDSQIRIRSFPADLSWKINPDQEVSRYSQGMLQVGVIVFDYDHRFLWRRRPDGEWALPGQGIVLQGDKLLFVAGANLASQTELVSHPHPAMILVQPESVDVFIIYAVMVKKVSIKPRPGEDLLWSREIPNPSLPLVQEALLAFEQLYPDNLERFK